MTGTADTRRGRRWTLALWAAAGAALLAPLIAMRFTDEVDWSPFDFTLAGALLFAVCLGVELAVRRTASAAYRTAAVIALAAGVLTVFLDGAVGIIGSEDLAANRLFLAIPAIALLGAIAARFRPAGMAWAMSAAALAQLLVPAAAAGWDPAARALVWSPPVLGLTGLFVAAWLVSASLFRKAA